MRWGAHIWPRRDGGQTRSTRRAQVDGTEHSGEGNTAKFADSASTQGRRRGDSGKLEEEMEVEADATKEGGDMDPSPEEGDTEF